MSNKHQLLSQHPAEQCRQAPHVCPTLSDLGMEGSVGGEHPGAWNPEGKAYSGLLEESFHSLEKNTSEQ